MDVAMRPTAVPAELLRCYLENLEALYAVDPRLASQIDALPFAELPKLDPARDGRFTVQVPADDGKPIFVHSRFAPLDEARTLVQTLLQPKSPNAGPAARADASGSADNAPPASAAELPAERAAPDEDLEHTCFFISGFGLGYAVTELERRFARPFLLVTEDDLALLKAGLCVTDVTAPLRDRRLTFLTAPDKSELHERLRPIITLLVLGLHFVTAPHTRRYHAPFHAEMSRLLRDFIQYARLQMVSVVRNARLTCRNAALNLRSYLAQPGVEVLTGRAKGFPAIVVAAGPSLARNVDQLRALQSHAVIIAVQTVLKTLLARGIRPHFVTTLDYHEVSAQFFRGIDDFSGIILVAEPKVSWQVLDAFHGRAHVLHSGFLADLLGPAAPERGALKAGSTVAHLAFYLAEHLGCDPVLLVGQDLSFSDGLYYPPGMQVESIWRPELGRFTTVEMKQWERIVRHRVTLRKVKDIHDREVYTDDQMFTYAEQFQSEFLATKTRVIHASEGGMRLAGTEVLTLRAAAERFCTRSLPSGLFDLPAGAASKSDSVAEDLGAAREQLELRAAEVREIRQICEDTLGLLDRLVGLVEKPAEFNRLVARIDDLHTRIRRNERTYALISSVAQLAELRRVQADRALREESEETPASARRRLRRDREYVTAFMDGCDFLLKLLPEALGSLSAPPNGAAVGGAA